MDVKEIAKKLVPLLGGKENIASAQHCATRLRLVIRDESKIDQKGLDEIEDVKGAFSNSGQFQIIFGTGLVNKIHAPSTLQRPTTISIFFDHFESYEKSEHMSLNA